MLLIVVGIFLWNLGLLVVTEEFLVNFLWQYCVCGKISYGKNSNGF